MYKHFIGGYCLLGAPQHRMGKGRSSGNGRETGLATGVRVLSVDHSSIRTIQKTAIRVHSASGGEIGNWIWFIQVRILSDCLSERVDT